MGTIFGLRRADAERQKKTQLPVEQCAAAWARLYRDWAEVDDDLFMKAINEAYNNEYTQWVEEMARMELREKERQMTDANLPARTRRMYSSLYEEEEGKKTNHFATVRRQSVMLRIDQVNEHVAEELKERTVLEGSGRSDDPEIARAEYSQQLRQHNETNLGQTIGGRRNRVLEAMMRSSSSSVLRSESSETSNKARNRRSKVYSGAGSGHSNPLIDTTAQTAISEEPAEPGTISESGAPMVGPIMLTPRTEWLAMLDSMESRETDRRISMAPEAEKYGSGTESDGSDFDPREHVPR